MISSFEKKLVIQKKKMFFKNIRILMGDVQLKQKKKGHKQTFGINYCNKAINFKVDDLQCRLFLGYF